MLDLGTPNFSDKERVLILFKEYDTLRAEIIARTKTQQGYLVVCASIIGFVIALGGKELAVAPTMGSSLVLIGVACAFLIAGISSAVLSARHTSLIGIYVKELENKINRTVGGEDLIGWEISNRE